VRADSPLNLLDKKLSLDFRVLINKLKKLTLNNDGIGARQMGAPGLGGEYGQKASARNSSGVFYFKPFTRASS
jgi:hypothetical protein